MAIAKPNVVTPPQATQEPFVSEQPFTPVQVDSKFQSMRATLAYVEGSSWILPKYYHILTTKDQDLTAIQTNLDPVFQQYQLINNLELKVTDPLSPSQDTESGEHKLQGSGTMFPGFKPHRGDMFLADIGDGRSAYFEIYDVEQKNVMIDSAYAISYRVYDYATQELSKKFDDKVTKETYFVKEFLKNRQNPLIVAEDYVLLQQCEANVHYLRKVWWREFYNFEFKTLLVPGQTEPTLDQFLMRHLDWFWPLKDRPGLQRVTSYSLDIDSGFVAPTLWNCLIEASAKDFWTIEQQVDFIAVRGIPAYIEQYGHGGLKFSGISFVSFPKDRAYGDGKHDLVHHGLSHFRIESPYSNSGTAKDLAYLLVHDTLDGLADLQATELATPLVHPVGVDDHYMLSKYFYTKAEYGQSQLELQTWNYLEHRSLDYRQLQNLCDDVKDCGVLERFYYIPILLFLLQAAIRGL